MALLALALSGCGGGGGGGTTTSTTTAPPGPTTTSTTTTTAPPYGASVKVVNYNLFWWCVSGNPQHLPERNNERCNRYEGGKGFQELYQRIDDQKPFDLIGFSEVINLPQIMDGIGLADTFDSFTAPPQSPGINDAGFAWSNEKFEKLGDTNSDLMCNDQYGSRYLTTQRLKVKETGETLIFANTHGGLVHCDGELGMQVAKNFDAAIAKYRQPEDSVIATGDFNCLPSSTQMTEIGKNFTRFHDKTMQYDNIIRSNWVRMDKNETFNAPPSDHSIISATLTLPKWPAGQPVPPDPPTPGAGPSPSPAAKSTCEKIGCDNHDDTCWCTESCVSHNSCCPDYQEKCAKSSDAEVV